MVLGWKREGKEGGGERRKERKKRKNNVRAYLHALEQLVDFFIRHLLAQLREDVTQLSGTDEPVAFLIKHLKPADKLLCSRISPHVEE